MTAPITDAFLDILASSTETSISDLVNDQKDMKSLLKVLSTPFEKFLVKCVNPHTYLEDITETYWPIKFNKRRITFRKNQ